MASTFRLQRTKKFKSYINMHKHMQQNIKLYGIFYLYLVHKNKQKIKYDHDQDKISWTV